MRWIRQTHLPDRSQCVAMLFCQLSRAPILQKFFERVFYGMRRWPARLDRDAINAPLHLAALHRRCRCCPHHHASG